MGRVLRGALAGLLATGVMTLVMFVAKALGLMREPPPKEITGRAARKAGGEAKQQEQEHFSAAWLAAHAGFGAAAGATYALVRPIVPGNDVAAGISYGLLVWAVNYLGLMPALGLYPFPDDDSTSRSMVMVAAHVVFGGTLGTLSPEKT